MLAHCHLAWACSLSCTMQLHACAQERALLFYSSTLPVSNRAIPSPCMNSFKAFQSLKTVAKSFGFKYVWHRRDSYLVRWRDGERTHVFSSAADLNVIATSYKAINDVAISHVNNNNTNINMEAKWLASGNDVTTRINNTGVKGLRAGFINACSLKKSILMISGSTYAIIRLTAFLGW